MVEVFIHRFKSLYFLLVGLAVVFGCVVRASPGVFASGNPYEGMKTGYDVSWPNCGATPPKDSSWGVIGVTGGLSLHENKCAVREASWFKTYALYANTGYPGATEKVLSLVTPKLCRATQPQCLAYNYGYAEGVYAVQLAAHQGLHSSIWWLDVETENSWDDDPLVNRASIQGSIDAVRHETVVARVGIYSYPGQWNLITGKWRPGDLPAWAATGAATAQSAKDFCRQASFTGGQLWLGQYTEGLDRNLPCPPGNKLTAAAPGNR